MTESAPRSLTELAAVVVESFVSHNRVAAADLPSLIATVRKSLAEAGNEAAQEPVEASQKASPSAIRRSVTPDALVSFIDGKPYRTLKRHLGTNGLTPETYRATYGLPLDYPIVAASYSLQRSAMAKTIGLGSMGRQKRSEAADAAGPVSKGNDNPVQAAAAQKAPETTDAPMPASGSEDVFPAQPEAAAKAPRRVRKPKSPKAIDPADDTFT